METKAGAPALLYVYAFVPTEEYRQAPMDPVEGMEAGNNIAFFVQEEITTVVSRVPEAEFAEQQLQKNVENMKWLQAKAFHHHEIMNQLHDRYTTIPLKFGTIFEQEASLKQMIGDYGKDIVLKFSTLADKEEWHVKIYAEQQLFIETVVQESEEIQAKEAEIESLPAGKRFFENKKMKQFIEGKADDYIEKRCTSFHDKLKAKSEENEVKKNWERKVTERENDMAWNAVYLIESKDRASFLQLVDDLGQQEAGNETGLDFECTGPWPFFHFSELKDRSETYGSGQS